MQMGPLMTDIGSGLSANSRSERVQIRTLEDGTIEERRTVTSIGPDGIPQEQVSVTIHGSNEGIESNHVGPSGIPVGPPGVDPFQLLFGQNGAQSAHASTNAPARPAQG